MPITLPRSSTASAQAITALVEKYGPLPAEYIDFLAVHDGTEPPPNAVVGTRNDIGVNRFIPASEVLVRANRIEGLSPKLLPFGEDDTGNFICIGANDHRVYFWDHEVDGERLIAESFAKFLDMLEPLDLAALDLEPEVDGVWVNPNFKPEF